jgi:hypothetical protein
MTRKEILDAAAKCVLLDRNADYGSPEDNFGLISDFWSDYIRARNPGVLLTPISKGDVAAMMVLIKVARLISSPKNSDHWIDIAGYAACGGQVVSVGPSENAKN